MGEKKKKEKRANGDGSIKLRSDGRYEAKIYLGKKADGKNNIKHFYGKSEAEARRKLNAFKKEMAKHGKNEIF